MSINNVRRGIAVAAIGMVAVLALAGCGGGDDDGTAYVEPKAPAIETVKVSGRNFAFTPNKIKVPEGVIAIEFSSEDGLHDLRIRGVAGFLLEANSEDAETKKIELKSGKYDFYCSIPGHESSGMKGTITVT